VNKGRMGLGTACREETSKMNNITIEKSDRKKKVFWMRKTMYSHKNSFNSNNNNILTVVLLRLGSETWT
jgi:hypothetical protein